jgi:hypothetical protein
LLQTRIHQPQIGEAGEDDQELRHRVQPAMLTESAGRPLFIGLYIGRLHHLAVLLYVAID